MHRGRMSHDSPMTHHVRCRCLKANRCRSQISDAMSGRAELDSLTDFSSVEWRRPSPTLHYLGPLGAGFAGNGRSPRLQRSVRPYTYTILTTQRRRDIKLFIRPPFQVPFPSLSRRYMSLAITKDVTSSYKNVRAKTDPNFTILSSAIINPGWTVRSADDSIWTSARVSVQMSMQMVRGCRHPYPHSATIYLNIHTGIRGDVRVELSGLRIVQHGETEWLTRFKRYRYLFSRENAVGLENKAILCLEQRLSTERKKGMQH